MRISHLLTTLMLATTALACSDEGDSGLQFADGLGEAFVPLEDGDGVDMLVTGGNLFMISIRLGVAGAQGDEASYRVDIGMRDKDGRDIYRTTEDTYKVVRFNEHGHTDAVAYVLDYDVGRAFMRDDGVADGEVMVSANVPSYELENEVELKVTSYTDLD